MNSEDHADSAVFISYSHADLSVAEKIEAELVNQGFLVWRDQKNLYAGARWPKELGKKISDLDAIVLLWSENASKSEFVEMEWCTSVALKKQIVPIFLDNTPLPHFLASIHGISIEDKNIDEKLIQALSTSEPAPDQTRVDDVLSALDAIEEDDAEKILKTAKAAFQDHNWINFGQVYSAGRDIHVTNIQQAGDSDNGGILKKWQTWVTLIVGLLTALVILIDLPQKIEPYIKKITAGKKCDLTITLENNSAADLGTSVLIVEGKEASERWTIPISAEIAISLEESMYNEWAPSIIWANGDRSVFAKQHGCTDSYQGESTDNLVGIRINAR